MFTSPLLDVVENSDQRPVDSDEGARVAAVFLEHGAQEAVRLFVLAAVDVVDDARRR
jgi:hypothetical protein